MDEDSQSEERINISQSAGEKSSKKFGAKEKQKIEAQRVMGLMTTSEHTKRVAEDNNMEEKLAQLIDFVRTNSSMVDEKFQDKEVLRTALINHEWSVSQAFKYVHNRSQSRSKWDDEFSPPNRSTGSSSQPLPTKKRTFSPSKNHWQQQHQKRGKPKQTYASVVSQGTRDDDAISIHDDDMDLESQSNQTTTPEHALSDLTHVISARALNQTISGDWRVKLCQTLSVKASSEILKQLDDTIETLVVMRKRESSQDFQTHNMKDAIAGLVDILSHLPNALRGDGLTFARHPTEHDLTMADRDARVAIQESDSTEEMKTNAKNLTNEARADFLSKRNYELVPKKAVDMLMKACELYIARYVWYKDAAVKLAQQHDSALDQIKTLQQELKEMYHENNEEIKVSQDILSELQRNNTELHTQLKQQIQIRADEMLAADPTANLEEIQFEAHFETMHSKDHHIKSLLASRKNNKAAIEKQKRKLAIQKEKAAYLSACAELCVKIVDLRRLSIQSAKDCFHDESEEMELKLTERLESYVPGLSTAILRFSGFQARRKTKADEKIAALTHELDEHLELFSDQAESNQKALKNNLSEYRSISTKAFADMRGLAVAQVSAWERLMPQLPLAGRTFVMAELRQLYEQLDGPLRQAYSSFLGSTTETDDEPSTFAATRSPPRPSSAKTAEFPVGTRLTTRFLIGGKTNKMISGRVMAVHENDKYTMHYDDGEIHRYVDRTYLLTDAEAEAERQALEDTEADDSSNESGGGGCLIM